MFTICAKCSSYSLKTQVLLDRLCGSRINIGRKATLVTSLFALCYVTPPPPSNFRKIVCLPCVIMSLPPPPSF